MDKEELIVLSIMKTFSGKIVTDYPGKGQKAVSGGGKPENPFPIGKPKKENKNENNNINYTFNF